MATHDRTPPRQRRQPCPLRERTRAGLGDEARAGERSDVHRHDLDYLLVFLAGDRIRVEPEPDTNGPYTDALEFDVPVGRTVFVERGGVETAVNAGSEHYREILIELKDEHTV